MEKIKEFIEKYGLAYDWRMYRRDSFVIWIPFNLIGEFLELTQILKYTGYECLGNSGVNKDTIGIDLTEAFYVEDIQKYFPKDDPDGRKVVTVSKRSLFSVEEGNIINDKYIVLEHFGDGTTAVIMKDLLEKRMAFGNTNDWRVSNVRKYLNTDHINVIENEFGKDNIVEHEVDLLSIDGLDDYGTTRDKISLLTIDLYRKYRKLLGSNMNTGWWLLTPDSTASGDSFTYVQYVNSGGSVGYDDCNWNDKEVRPFFILRSSILVSCDQEVK